MGVMPKPPSACESCRRMRTQALSCSLHFALCWLVPFFEESVSDFAVDLRLLVGGEVILRDVCVEILKAGGLAESDELIMNEAVSEGV